MISSVTYLDTVSAIRGDDDRNALIESRNKIWKVDFHVRHFWGVKLLRVKLTLFVFKL